MAVSLRRPGLRGFFSEIGGDRLLTTGAVVVIALALQSTLLVKATVLGVIPQLTLVVVACYAFLEGENVGTVAGFAAGLLQDLLLPQSVMGLTAFVYTLVGFGVGYLRGYAPVSSVWAPILAVTLASAAAEISYAGLAIMLGQPWVSISFTMRVVGLVVLYNTLMAPLVFPLIRRLSERVRPERIYRW